MAEEGESGRGFRTTMDDDGCGIRRDCSADEGESDRGFKRVIDDEG